MRRLVVVALLVLALAACKDGDKTSAEPSPSPTPGLSETPGASEPSSEPSSESPSDSPTESPTVEPDPGVDKLVVPAAVSSVQAPWVEAFVIPYGPGKEPLGTSPGGYAGTLDIGPEYGAPGPDGTWWFLDYAKGRLAHYDAEGEFLDQLKIDKSLLVGGRYFQWQLPHVLADGTLVAIRFEGRDSFLLRVRDGVADEVRIKGSFSPVFDDGALLYGSLGRGKYVVVDPADGSRQRITTFRTPSGTPFFVGNGFDNGRLRVELPDAGVTKAVPMRTTSGALAHVGTQVRAGADDVLHLFLLGIGEDDESVQLVGYSSVSPSGAVTQVEALPNPSNESDPGSPAQLVMAPGSSTPMLVYVLGDGVHVYERVQANGPVG